MDNLKEPKIQLCKCSQIDFDKRKSNVGGEFKGSNAWPSSYRTAGFHREYLYSPAHCAAPILTCYFRDRQMLTKKASILTPVLTGGTVIPAVVDVQVQLLRRCQSSTMTKPPDWGTVIWTRDTGDDTRGQTKLAHQRGESTLQAISCSSLQWIGSPSGRPLGSERADHISQMGRIGKRGDLSMSLVFRMTKNSRTGEISVLADFTGLQKSSRTAKNRFILAMYGSFFPNRNHSQNLLLGLVQKWLADKIKSSLNLKTLSSWMQVN